MSRLVSAPENNVLPTQPNTRTKMPILFIYGMPEGHDQDHLEMLALCLREDVTGIHQLQLVDTQVTVFFPSSLQKRNQGKEVIAIIQGLFRTPERTPAVKQVLAEAIKSRLVAFTQTELPQCNLIEVMINEYDPDASGFASYSAVPEAGPPEMFGLK